MEITFQKKEILDLEVSGINTLDLLVLEMYASNYSKQEIISILELDEIKYALILNNILFRYDACDLFQAISMACDLGHIDRYDLVKDEVKKEAVACSKKIFEYFEGDNFNRCQQRIIEGYLMQIIVNTRKAFISNFPQGTVVSLSSEEIKYCRLKLLSYTSAHQVYLKPLLGNSTKREQNLMAKFQMNNFFNTVRRIFEFGLMDGNSFHSGFSNIELSLVGKKSDAVCLKMNDEGCSSQEKKQSVYFMLIEYYNMLEDKIIFKSHGLN
jgi:hypothetical protein